MAKRSSTNATPSPQPRSPTEDEPLFLPQPQQAINLDGSIDQVLALENHVQQRASILPPQVTAPLNVPKKPLPSPPISPESVSEPTEAVEQQQQDQSYGTYEIPSTRLSDAYFEDAEVGIGLNMLQALADDDDDDDSSDASHYSTRFSLPPPAATTVTSKLKSSSTPTPPTRSTHDTGPRAPSLVPSIASSGSWEGAIYDDYRYSRYSIASKVSRFSTISSSQQPQQPPPPPVPEPKMSLDSRSGAGRPSFDSVSVRIPPRASSMKLPPPLPTPLSLQPKTLDPPPAEPSPLLHTNWASPTSPSTKPPEEASPAADGNDDEELPSNILSLDLHDSPSSSPELTLNKKDGEDKEKEKTAGDDIHTPSPPPISNASASPNTPSPSNRMRPSVADSRRSFLPHPNAPKPPPASEAAGPMYLQTPQEREKRLSMAFSSLSSKLTSPLDPPSPLPSSLISASPNSQHFPLPPSASPRLNSAAAVQLALSKISQQRSAPPPGLPNATKITIYGRTDVELSTSTRPVPIIFSLDPFTSAAPPTQYRVSQPQPPPQPREENMARAPPRNASLRTGKPSTASLSLSTPSTPPAASTAAGMMDSLTFTTRTTTTSSPQASTMATSAAPPQLNVPIPRSNFFPKLPGSRPRSRSFSAFDSGNTGGGSPGTLGTNRSDPGRSSDLKNPLNNELKRSTSSHNLKSLNGISLGAGAKSTSPSVSQKKDEEAERLESPVITLNATSLPETSSVPNPQPQMVLRIQGANGSSSHPPPAPPSPVEPLSEKLRARPSVDTDAASITSDTRSFFTSSLSGHRESLRSKLSLPNLRKHKTKQDETASLASAQEVDTVQVKDMDFELVRPNLPFLATRNEDLKKDGLLDPSGLPGSPALSTFSNRSPTIHSDHSTWPSPKPDSKPPPAESEQLLDAHRQRELKWVSLISSVPPSQSRKTKKIKKLLLEGVPASVRYLVWTHITNGRARIVAGVYSQLCSRGSVAASNLIAADVERHFKDYPQLQGPESSVLTVLQAYLNMVPDVQYNTGLALIMGQLLLQGPDEEVFWIFVSLMDSHLRPYFSVNSIQLEVDATLFSRVLEANDPQVAKKMLMEMSIAPEAICSSWFTSVFVDTLPPRYINRVWDIFMYEGIPFLIRVGLVVVSCCRRQILRCKEEKALLELIRHPPQQLLPPHPDILISLSLNQKVKDDDVRKQRVKMEAQVRRQAQAQTSRKSTTLSTISFPSGVV